MLAELTISANGTPVRWARATMKLYAFHIMVAALPLPEG
jgi:hypothetical protein